MPSQLKAALLAELQRSDLTEADRDHLKRWIDSHDLSGDDSMWERIDAAAGPGSGWPGGTICRAVVSYALHARQIAEAARFGRDLHREERQQQRDELLALAQKAEDLAKYYRAVARFSGIAQYFKQFLLPIRSLWMFHEYEAELLRQRAGREPQPTTFISRQSGGKKKRGGSREINAFMVFMVDRMREECGKACYDAVAEMTNAAFPEADVTADDVGLITRAARRRTTDTLKRKKEARVYRGGLAGS
jgi:hypothetical protein